MSTPLVPPRPSRSHAGTTAVKQDTPQIPPRPVRKSDPSPDRDFRSPLNYLPGSNGGRWQPPHGASTGHDPVRRPSSVAIPSEVGEEGIEYTSYDQLPAEAKATQAAPAASEQTRNVSADLPIHQPKASVPHSTAKSRIQGVTRTDSTQAAAAGIGKAQPDDDVHKGPSDTGAPISRVTSRTYDDHLRRVPSTEPQSLRPRGSFSRPGSSFQNGTPRPPSVHSQDVRDGIPEIGQQIPLYKNAGDVQAPSPAPTQSQFTPGIGFFNDGSTRSHHRKRSSRQEFGPPGSYGLHHGAEPHDQFERDWVLKHPEEAAKEGYHPYLLRPETALSSEQLNRIVSENQDVGMGTSPGMVGTPSQDIAFEATDQFAFRINTPKASPAPLTEASKRLSGDRPAPTESPLRKSSFPFHETKHMRNDKAIESEDDEVIHEGRGIPILASDEVIKRPSSAFLEPAVEASPADRDYDSDDMPPSRRSSLKPLSRPSSRPSSMHGYHGGPLHRFISHEEHHGSGMGTPLEEIEEYEPLFPEEEDGERQPKRQFRQRPGLAQHHFPSQDIWEDTPSSLQYSTTVQTPEPPAEKIAASGGAPGKVFETPEQEEARKTKNPAGMLDDSKTFAKPHFKPGVLEEQHSERPGVRRFPSRDIWEDTPDSMRLVTTVSSPQMEEVRSPPEDRPTTSALPSRQDEAEARSTTGLTQLMRPGLPARPERKSKLAEEIKPAMDDERSKEPTIPDRPKPTVPARPARAAHADQAEGEATTREAPTDEAAPPASAQKAKPAVPARPAGSKIAAMQGAFMNDLNNRLKLGPQGPSPKAQEPEPEAESDAPKEPLSDARKGRAKGPARRKPAGAATDASGFSFSTPTVLWQIDESDELHVTAMETAEADMEPNAELEKQMSANEAAN
ncbi:hypothetical protein BAUCODRAFT_96090, partial [Baudoinia panamericana UAMH 10762]